MKLTVVAAGLILAILLVSNEPTSAKVVDLLDRSEIGPTVGPSSTTPLPKKSKAQARQGFAEDDYYEEEEDDEEEEELQQSFNNQEAADQPGGGAGAGFEEDEDDNEDEEGDEEDEEEDDDQDEQRFMEDKRFLKAVYDIL